MNPSTQPLDRRTFAIGILSVTACILFAAFVLVSLQPPRAYGIGQNDRGGDYLMLTQQLSTSEEGVAVVDAASKRMIVYYYDYNKRSILPLTTLELDKLPPVRQR